MVNGNPTQHVSMLQAEILTPELEICCLCNKYKFCSWRKYLLNTVSTTWELVYMIKKKRPKSPPHPPKMYLLSRRTFRHVSAGCCHCLETSCLMEAPLLPAPFRATTPSLLALWIPNPFSPFLLCHPLSWFLLLLPEAGIMEIGCLYK